MKILAIDYGRKKLGFAMGDTQTRLAEPWRVQRYKDIKILISKIKQILLEEQIEQIIVGVSEGEMGKESKEFGQKLEKELNIPVVFQDETLTSSDAQSFSIEAGIGRKKRKGMEDAYAASLILQSYLDNYK